MKCAHCPLKDRPEPCFAITSGHKRFCDLAVNKCQYRVLIWTKSTNDLCPFSCDEPEPVTVVQAPVVEPAPEPKPAIQRKAIRWTMLTPEQREKYASQKGCGCGSVLVVLPWDELTEGQKKWKP